MERLFDDDTRRKKKDCSKTKRIYLKLRPFIIFIISLSIVTIGIVIAISKVYEYFFMPVDIHDPTPITVTIESSASASTIAEALFKSGLIRNKSVFKIFVDFMGKSDKLHAGSYIFAKNMEIEQMVDALVKGEAIKNVIKFTIPEGNNVENIAQILINKGVLKDSTRFISLCKEGTNFTQYEFINEIIKQAKTRKYTLEGYLFPDTYEVYEGTGEETIITKLLTRFFNIYTDEYANKATELSMSMDQIITLASLIEKEAKTADFKKVSAVFHNRLNKKKALESCASVQYIYSVKKLVFTAEELAIDSPYNTYKYTGLPVGPICNPGKNAIEAALYPDEQYVKDGYMYFCLKDPKTGELDFSKTYQEHMKKVEAYKNLWLESDKQAG